MATPAKIHFDGFSRVFKLNVHTYVEPRKLKTENEIFCALEETNKQNGSFIYSQNIVVTIPCTVHWTLVGAAQFLFILCNCTNMY